MAEHIFERLARERGITVEEMREIISDRIEKGWNDPDSEKRAQWRKIPCVGDIPTPDEWLRHEPYIRGCWSLWRGRDCGHGYCAEDCDIGGKCSIRVYERFSTHGWIQLRSKKLFPPKRSNPELHEVDHHLLCCMDDIDFPTGYAYSIFVWR